MKINESLSGYLLILPIIVVISLFAFLPIGQTIWLSLHELKYRIAWFGLPFVGLDNYIWAFSEPDLWRTLGYTLYFTGFSVVLEFWIGLGMALAMNRAWRGRGILRMVVIIPWAIPPLVQATMWRWMFHPDVGVIVDVLLRAGVVSKPPNFLGNEFLAMHSVIWADVWKCSCYMSVLLLAGLAAIPQDLYDAAKVDGGRGWFRFRHITLPILYPVIVVALLFRTMDAFRVFDLVYGLTGGGPGRATETMSTFAYSYYFSYIDFGRGSALAVITFIFLLIPCFFYVRSLSKRLEFK